CSSTLPPWTVKFCQNLRRAYGPSAMVNSASSSSTSLPGWFERLSRPRSTSLIPSVPPLRMVITTLAKVPSGIRSPEACGSTSFMSKGMALSVPGLIDLGEQPAQIGRLGRVEAAGAVLGRQTPWVARRADEAADLALVRIVLPSGLAVGAVLWCEEAQRQHLVDDARQLPGGLATLHLRL